MELPGHFERLILPHCRFADPAGPLAPDTPLSELGVDSLEIVELIVDIEDAYRIELPQELLTPEVFASPATIWQALRDSVAGLAERAGAES
ncbi:MAG TPA: phosphopantetheine-binding protein [Streptosporangiaceae bacterium]